MNNSKILKSRTIPDFREEEMHVCIDDTEQQVTLSFFAVGNGIHTLNRPLLDSMASTVARLERTITKMLAGTRKKKEKLKNKIKEVITNDQIDAFVLYYNERVLLEDLTNQNWKTGMSVSVRNRKFHVVIDPPTIISICTFPRRNLAVGYPIVPAVESANCEGVDYQWCSENSYNGLDSFQLRSQSEIFTPSTALVGHRIKVFCTPYKLSIFETSERKNTCGKQTVATGNTNTQAKVYGRSYVFYLSGTVSPSFPRPKSLSCRSDYCAKRRSTAHTTRNYTTAGMNSNSSNCCGDGIDGRSGGGGSSLQCYNGTLHDDVVDYLGTDNTAQSSTSHGISTVFSASASALQVNVTAESPRVTVRDDGVLRIVTYNVLAEPFATSEQAVKILYSYCDPEYLDTEYRVALVTEELLAYDADVICLQEVDSKVYTQYYRPLLHSHGYDGHYTNKSSGVREGCATFTRRSVMTVTMRIDVPLKSLLTDQQTANTTSAAHGDQSISPPSFKTQHAVHLSSLYNARPDLKDIIGGKLGAVAQITICEWKRNSKDESKILIFLNTHLFFHPAADFIRLLQVDALIRLLVRVKNQLIAGRAHCQLDLLDIPLLEIIRYDCDGNPSVEKNITTSFSQIKLENISSLTSTTELHLTQLQSYETHSHHNQGLCAPSFPIALPTMVAGTPSISSVLPNIVTCVLLGDFNSSRDSPAQQYICQGYAPSSDPVWGSVSGFSWGASDAASKMQFKTNNKKLMSRPLPVRSFSPPELHHELKLISAAGYTPFTNYVGDFKDLLDYVFIESDIMTVDAVSPFPAESILSENVALPSSVFPSDHLAVAVDVRLKFD